MATRSLAIGDTEIIAFADAVPEPVSPSWSFPDVPPEAWPGHAEGSLDEAGCFRPNLGCFVVRSPDRTLLVDMGIGPGPNAYLEGIGGRLPDLLAEAGLGFADISGVIFTHLHMDHVGWATTAGPDGGSRVSCPDVPHYVAARELAWWQDASSAARPHHRMAYDACIAPVLDAGLMRPIDGDQAFLPGVRYLATPGHTPGHSSVVIDTGQESLVITGDVFHCPAQVARPDWSHRADHDRDTARTSRETFIDTAAARRWLLAAGHFRDGWTFGRIAATASGHRFDRA